MICAMPFISRNSISTCCSPNVTRRKSFKALPQFPSSRRDVAILVPEATTHEAVLQTVKSAKPANLESLELFDVFRGQGIPKVKKFGVCVHVSFAGKNTDRCRCEQRARKSRGKSDAEIGRGRAIKLQVRRGESNGAPSNARHVSRINILQAEQCSALRWQLCIRS